MHANIPSFVNVTATKKKERDSLMLSRVIFLSCCRRRAHIWQAQIVDVPLSILAVAGSEIAALYERMTPLNRILPIEDSLHTTAILNDFIFLSSGYIQAKGSFRRRNRQTHTEHNKIRSSYRKKSPTRVPVRAQIDTWRRTGTELDMNTQSVTTNVWGAKRCRKRITMIYLHPTIPRRNLRLEAGRNIHGTIT